ncbi:MAG TPA: CehA/McbA family metallohydrolase [candidate division Zixibacteria bacterium]|nr:CehA/McbA family metallohydrolase [candidate division Zixibacteria bacterium]
MKTPPTSKVRPIDLAMVFNTNRSELHDRLRSVADESIAYGHQTFRGLPFQFGDRDQLNVILLNESPVHIELDDIKATYLLFAHVVEDRVTNYLDGLADVEFDGNELGQHVSDYEIRYDDGMTISTPIHRRFAIQQSRSGWGASPFMAVPALEAVVTNTMSEAQQLGSLPDSGYGEAEVRHTSGRDTSREHLWLYALANPHPEKGISRLTCIPRTERSLIFAISYTGLIDHPLRGQTRQKLRLSIPPGVNLNAIDELSDIGIDMGTVISARASLDYDETLWLRDSPDVQPLRNDDTVIVEYAAHPEAKMYVGAGENQHVFDLADPVSGIEPIAPASRPVNMRIVEKGSNIPVAVRLHIHGEAGEYLPPRGHHRKVNGYWFEDNYGEFANGLNQYSYVPGECVVDLPIGKVFVEITKGYEITPIRSEFTVTPESDEVAFKLERVLPWRENGWVTADTHVHFLSPQTALLEGAAEGVNVVNLLASQWGEMFSNVTDFDGRTTLGAKEFGGDGEFLVRVGTENRMQVLGHISLLGYSGRMIHPLCTGGPSESALGDPQEVTMYEWARRCLDQKGLVVMPHGPNPQCERAADIVLGVVDAMEMMTFNPHDWQISPYGIADWYRYLNLGYHVPVVGGSDKMAASFLLGGIRTYTQMGDLPFNYENWMAAIRSGNTFVTVGPLAELKVEGLSPGSRLNLPSSGGSVSVFWKVESVRLPIEQVEIVVGGLVGEQVNIGGALACEGSTTIKIDSSTWIALRVRGSYRGKVDDIAAHTSAVQVIVEGSALYSAPDATAVLEQIEGAIAYVDTLAPRPEFQRFKQLRATLEGAYNRMHQRMHKQGRFHQHTPLHHHDSAEHIA